MGLDQRLVPPGELAQRFSSGGTSLAQVGEADAVQSLRPVGPHQRSGCRALQPLTTATLHLSSSRCVPRDAAAPGAPHAPRVLQPSASAEFCSAWACRDAWGSHPAGWSLWGCWTCAAASSRVMSCDGVETHSDSSDSSRPQSTEAGEGIKMGAQQ